MFKLFIPRGEKILHLVWSVNRANFFCLIYMFDTNFSRLKLNCQIMCVVNGESRDVLQMFWC